MFYKLCADLEFGMFLLENCVGCGDYKRSCTSRGSFKDIAAAPAP